MKINYLLKTKVIITLIFLVFSSIISSIWFKDGLMFAGGEDQIPFYNIPRAKSLFTSSWQDLGTGFPQIFNLPKTGSINVLNFLWDLGIKEVELQKIVFTSLIFIGITAVGLLTFNLTVNRSRPLNVIVISIMSGLFYFLNPFSMSQIWGRGLYFQFYFFALLPLSVYLLDSWIRSKKDIYILVFLLCNWILSWSYGHPANFLSLIFANVAYMSTKVENLKSALKYIFWIFNLLMMNIYWIVPFVIHGNSLTNSVSVKQDQLSIFESLSSQSSIEWVLRLMNKGNFSINSQYGEYYLGGFVVIISFILAVITIFSLFNVILRKKNFEIVLIFLIGLIISLGSNPPFGSITKQIFTNIPQFQVYRNSFEKAGILIIFPLSILIGLLLIRIKKFKKLLIISSIGFVFFGIILVKPIWTGKFSGGEIFRPWIQIPKEYIAADRVLRSIEDDFRVLQLPLIPGDGIKYDWPHFYQGIESSEYIFSKPSIGRDVVVNQDYYTALLNRFGKTSVGSTLVGRGEDHDNFKRDTLSEELFLLGVRYIVLHKDVDTKFSGANSFEETKKIIDQDKQIGLVYENNKLAIYENKLGSKKLISIDNLTNIDYFQTKYGYHVNIKDAKISEVELNYQFNSNWVLRTNNNELAPSRINDFNMKWIVDRSISDFELIFKPQATYVKSLEIFKYYLLFIYVVILTKTVSKIRGQVN